MGKSAQPERTDDEMKCADSYMALPGLSIFHIPPTVEPASTPSKSMPARRSASDTDSPDGPAPTTSHRSGAIIGLGHGATP